jgi:hypothetical protein
MATGNAFAGVSLQFDVNGTTVAVTMRQIAPSSEYKDESDISTHPAQVVVFR